MSSRRRNLFVILLMLGFMVGSVAIIITKETKLGLDLKGGVELVYQGEPTPQSKVTPEAIDRAIDIIRERVDRLGVAEPEIQRLGSDQISVGLPGVKNLERAKKQVGKTAQLLLYDWERNVTFKFPDEGRNSFQEVPRRLAERGQTRQIPGQPVESSFQTFAIVLDREVVSRPFIDYRENPNGI